MSLTARERELVARDLLSHQEKIPQFMAAHRWEELHALAAFVSKDIAKDIAQTDPALFRTLRSQVTEYYIKGWGSLNLAHLSKLAQGKPV